MVTEFSSIQEGGRSGVEQGVESFLDKQAKNS